MTFRTIESNLDEVGQMRRSSGISINTRTTEQALEVACQPSCAIKPETKYSQADNTEGNHNQMEDEDVGKSNSKANDDGQDPGPVLPNSENQLYSTSTIIEACLSTLNWKRDGVMS